MSQPAPATWLCPICGRRVPRRESECFCGAKQQAAAQHHKKEREKTSNRIPLDVALLLLAAVMIGVYALHRMTREPAEPQAAAGSVPVVTAATPEPPLAAPAPRQSADPPPAFQRAPPPPLPPQPQAAAFEPVRAAAPAPEPTPTPRDERAEVRAAGLQAYEAALQRLSADAARLEEYVRLYKSECSEAQRFGGISNCGEIEASIRKELSQIQQGLDAAEDDARRAWLEPGQVRDARGRSVFGSRQWDETHSAAQKLRR